MVNNYLLHKLFVNAHEDSLYNKWFPKIWGCPQLFEDFLNLASTQSQKTVALDIVRHMSTTSDFSIPYSAFVNLVEVEHQGDDWGWINQDHAVHSVNVYICGIYLFFFYQPLQQQILRYFLQLGGGSQNESPLDEAVSAAIRCIRLSALYHDVGYILERTVNRKGYFIAESGISLNDLFSYEIFDIEVVYDITKKAIANTLFTQAILEQSQDRLETQLKKTNWISDTSKWKRVNTGELLEGNNVKTLLEPMANMTQITFLSSWEGMKYLAPYLSDENILTIACDLELRPVIVRYGSTANPIVYCRRDIPSDAVFLSHIGELKPLELKKHGLILFYYVRWSKIPLPKEIQHLEESIKLIAHHCRQRFSSDFGLMFSEEQIPQLLCKISEWIERKVPLPDLDAKVVACKTKQKQIDNELITRLYRERAIRLLNNQKMEVLAPESQMEKLGKSFLHEIQGANFLSELYREYNRISNTDPDTTCDAQLQELTKIVYQTIKELAKPSKQRKPVIEIKAGKINEYKVIFRGLEKNRFTESTSVKQLFKLLERNLNALGLKWEDIEAYKPRHNFFDHGKVSAGLLIEGYGIYSSVMERMGESPFFRSVWQIPEDMQALNKKYEVKNEIVEAIFAVLMHNIWVKSDSNPSGLAFMQDVSVNAMSYYLAFCDTLQFWDRDKLFDPAKQRQPDTTYYGKDFDICVEKNRIVVRCRSEGVKERIYSKLNSMDDFLKDASSMLKIVECL